MKKSYLAAAAILGAAVFAGEAHSAKIDLGKTKFKMGFRAKVHATFDGQIKGKDEVSDLKIDVPFTRIYAKGSISKILKWGWQMEFGRVGKASDVTDPKKVNTPEFIDSFIMLNFSKAFRVLAGSIKVPWERHAGIQSGWSLLIPTGVTAELDYKIPHPDPNKKEQKVPASAVFKNPFSNDKNARSGSRSNQLGVWGDVAGGMLRYYVTLVDQNDAKSDTDSQTGLAVRVQFAPTMMGFKNDKGYVLKESYLGKRDVLVLGVSYATQSNFGNAKNNPMAALGVDLMWEQKMGGIVPNVQIGFTQITEGSGDNANTQQGILAQGQILFNTKTMLGKPAIAVKYVQANPSTQTTDPNLTVSTISVAGQLYVKGIGNRIALVADSVSKPQNAIGKKSYTNITLAAWFNF